MPNSSSRAMTRLTVSSESAPRSFTNDASFLISASATPSCSATIFLTRCSILSITPPREKKFKNTGARILSGLTRQKSRASGSCQGMRPMLLQTHQGADSNRNQLLHVHAAVHVQRRTGDVASLRRREKCDRMRDVFRAAETAERNLRFQHGVLFFGQRLRHVGIDKTRGDAVDRDAAAADLARERTGHAGDTRLRGRVVDLPRVAGRTDYRRDVDDAATLGLHH